MNTVLLLLTAILTSVSSCRIIKYWLTWYEDQLVLMPPTVELVQGDCLNVVNWIMFSVAAVSLVTYRWQRNAVEKSKMLLSSLAIADICFSAFFVLNLAINLGNFALRSFSEWHWFMYGASIAYDKWLAETAESKGQGRAFEHRPYLEYHKPELWQEDFRTTTSSPTTSSSFQEWISSTRTPETIALLLLEPSITILALLTILVNIVNIWRIRAAVKRSNLWASNSLELYPKYTQLYSSYSSFWQYGILKIVNWIIPVSLMLVIIYTPAGIYDCYNLIIILALCFVLCFCQWIFYVRKARFRTGIFCSSSDEQILSSIAADFAICCASAIFYFVFYNNIPWRNAERFQKFTLCAVLFTFTSMLANLRLIHAYGGMRKFSLKLPRIQRFYSKKANTPKSGADGQIMTK
ncbi:hypothetical protein DdX_19831 [Ditylenchus destructor]|uniref:G-protein coupled receptors family 1 profile domain-containing protein n=1 Tax=Ditylenchus destructor TaxID=166010 RepID=A0AAD4MI86_9BILA|nr:hypothetical protein DdX_19831 [Ditylenchus destructor]